MAPIRYIINACLNRAKFVLNRKRRCSISILNARDTVKHIREKKLSVGRYGDGELNMIFNYLDNVDTRKSGFQKYDSKLGRRLYEILSEGCSDNFNFKVGLPGCMLSIGTSYLRGYAAVFWHEYSNKYLNRLLSIIPKDKSYVDTNFSRFYLSHKNKSDCRDFIENVKTIWKDRDIIIVEGNRTCLGVGNDLFAEAKSIRRILCSATNAWESYDKILTSVKANAKQENSPLILLALGMTATILAYDLARAGLQAIDIGHIDIEYEWMRMGATQRIAVPGKFTNESKEGKQVIECTDSNYLAQVIARI